MNINDNQTPLLDHRFNIKSYEQFIKDNKVKKFNKICMTEVVNADLMIATFGEEQYFKTCAEILTLGNMAYQQMGIDNLIYVYIHTYKTFMAVANSDMSDDDFYGLMKENHKQYEIIRAQQTELGGVSRFILAFGDDLINKTNSAGFANQDLQNNFIVAGNEREKLLESAQSNAKKFDLIHHALNNDKVIPFYQGIYNNKTNKIEKYEALMRLIDKDGNICPPYLFLDASKELKLYLSLSKVMINKCLNDFVGKESFLSLNVSLLDIQSDEFSKWLLERLQAHPTPEKVFIEFVETENYNGQERVFEFLNKVRDIGCKIAIDDFGVGFSTYTSVISLKPDIIKIDGDIIKSIDQSEDKRIILSSIVYMAKLVGARTTAEFVENKEIYDVLLDYDVDFSQGYYFAKPQAFCELDIK